MVKNLLVSFALLSSPFLQCGKHKKVKKEKRSGVYEKRIACFPDMTVDAFKKLLARNLNADPEQVTIILDEHDIVPDGKKNVQEMLMKAKDVKLKTVVNEGVRKPRAPKKVVRKKVYVGATGGNDDIKKDIEAFLNN